MFRLSFKVFEAVFAAKKDEFFEKKIQNFEFFFKIIPPHAI